MNGRVRSILVLAVFALNGLASTQATAQNARSAQSDCSREAARRGYSVLQTSGFRQVDNGWQLEMRVRDSRGRIEDGTCMVFSSGGVRIFGLEGGGGGGGADGMTFNCASRDAKYKECQLPVDGRVELRQRWSEARCQEGYSWGQRRDRVWVDHGCRAEFEVIRGGWGGGGGGSGGSTVDCRSSNSRYVECRLPGGRYATLDREYSNRKCREGYSWGSRPGMVWVSNDCQARFRASDYGGGGGSGGGGGDNHGQQQRAEVQCRNEARRQDVDVREVSRPEYRGAYWQATVHGTMRGRNVQGDCRFDPRNNEATVFIGSSGGSGGGGWGGGQDDRVRAEQACHEQAQRLGYRVVGTSGAQSVQGGMRVGLQVKQGNQIFNAACFWNRSNGRTNIEQVLPAPR